VTITDNEFSSTLPPTKGAWIVAEDSGALRTSGNKHPSNVPLMKEDTRSK
jgi:hypothetical protein